MRAESIESIPRARFWPGISAHALTTLLNAACGTCLVSVLLLPWTRSHAGSTLSGNAFAALLRASGREAAAVGIYSGALAGAIVVATAALAGVRAGVLRTVVGAAACATLIWVGLDGPLPPGNWGLSPALAFVGGAGLVLGGLVDLRRCWKRRGV